MNRLARASLALTAASFALICAFAGSAVAAPVTFKFAGVVDGSEISGIPTGSTFSGTYTFESTTPAADGSNDVTAVFDALDSLSFTINGLTYSSSANAEIQVGNEGTNGSSTETSDRYSVVSRASQGLSGPTIPGGVEASDSYVIDSFIFRLDDHSGNLFSTALDLPTDINLSDFDSSGVFINFDEVVTQVDPLVNGHLTSFGLATTGVPEPVTLSIFGTGLIAGAAMRRRHKKALQARK